MCYPVYRRSRGAASCTLGDSVAEIGVNGASCYIGASNPIPVLVPLLQDSRSFGNCTLSIGAFGMGLTFWRRPESGPVGCSVPVLRWRSGRSHGPRRLTLKVGAGDHPGEDAQAAPQRLPLLGGVRRRLSVCRWVPSVGPSHSAPRRGSRRQACGRRCRPASACAFQCGR